LRVIVVGAGVVGLSAAWALLRAGHRPVVVDQGPIPNPLASSSDRHRLIRLAHSADDGRGRIIHEAYAAWDRLWADLGRSHYLETGMLMTAREPGDWAVSCRAAFERDGVAHEVWDRQTLAARCPHLLLTDGDWGLYTATGGALLADRILADLAMLLRERGAELVPHAPAEAVEPARPVVRLRDGRRLGGDAVVLAAGAWSGALLPALAPSLEPRRAVVLYLVPPPDLAAGWAGSPSLLDLGGPSDLYVVPPLRGLPLKFGAGLHSRPCDPSRSRTLERDEPESLLAHLRPFVRGLDRYAVVEARVCYTCHTPDDRFAAGALAGGPVVYATGCCGQMFKFGAVVGERLAAAATGAFPGAALTAWARGEAAPLPAAA
jgi:sarcosine oxidase